MSKRLIGCAMAALPLLAAGAFAQSFPNKPVRWIVPFPPGGGTDAVSRTIAQKLSEAWGVQVIADNRPGSGGTIGLAAAAKSPPDGYTIVLGATSNVSIAPGMYSKLPYDPQQDLVAVTQVVSAPLVIVAHPSFPARNAKELVAYARAKPGVITFGSAGSGTLGHLSVEMLKSMARVDLLHVPYKGTAPVTIDVLGGQIVLYSGSIPAAASLIKAGKLRAIGTTGAKRVNALPDVPTVAESALPGYEAVNWYGVFLPARTPGDLVARLHGDIVRVLRLPDVQERLGAEGGDVVANTPEQFAAFIRTEITRWTKVVGDAGARVD